MASNMDYSTTSSKQIESVLCNQVERIRLARNITQKQLAKEAGVSLRTIGRLKRGEGISLDTFIRVLTALNIQHHLATLLPDPTIRPVERISGPKKERKRARPKPSAPKTRAWSWGDGK